MELQQQAQPLQLQVLPLVRQCLQQLPRLAPLLLRNLS
jgi:hypothetical protein